MHFIIIYEYKFWFLQDIFGPILLCAVTNSHIQIMVSLLYESDSTNCYYKGMDITSVVIVLLQHGLSMINLQLCLDFNSKKINIL